MIRFAKPGLVAGLLLAVCQSPADAQTVGASMVEFLQGSLNQRLGGGECAHLAAEALRVSGGEFIPSDLGADSPGAGDLVWGDLVTVISYANKKWTDASPANRCQPGDVLQFGSGTLIGKTKYSTRHTAVVSTVDTTKFRPANIYQQNFGGNRTVQTAAIDLAKLTAGWVRIYRPRVRQDANNTWKVSIVNNASTSQSCSLIVESSTVSSFTLGAANTATSFRTMKAGTSGVVPCLALPNGASLYLLNARGVEIYTAADGTLGIRYLAK